MSNYDVGNPPGLRHKWPGQPWEKAYVRDAVPQQSPKIKETIFNHGSGITIGQNDLPEASTVYNMKLFTRTRDVFFAGGILAVKAKIAAALMGADFGLGGGLVAHAIYEKDEKTPIQGQFYLVNFGPRKDCFRSTEKPGIRKLATEPATGRIHWSVDESVGDNDIVLSRDALEGSDVWMCPGLFCRIFMKDRVVKKLLASGANVEWAFRRCTVG